jgi:hypothetical protein
VLIVGKQNHALGLKYAELFNEIIKGFQNLINSDYASKAVQCFHCSCFRPAIITQPLHCSLDIRNDIKATAASRLQCSYALKGIIMK